VVIVCETFVGFGEWGTEKRGGNAKGKTLNERWKVGETKNSLKGKPNFGRQRQRRRGGGQVGEEEGLEGKKRDEKKTQGGLKGGKVRGKRR